MNLSVMPVLALLLEVMDKEPGVMALWVSALVLGVVGLALARWRWWAGLPFLLLLGVGFIATLSEVRDPYVGPAIVREAGRLYAWHLVASTALAVSLVVCGMWQRARAV